MTPKRIRRSVEYKETEKLTREGVLSIIEKAREDGWTELDLRRKNLSELPSEVGQLAELRTLSLNGNSLSSLPESIGKLSKLQTLDASDNQLEALPASIGEMSGLNKLYLCENKISVLPNEIGNLTNLTHLELGYLTMQDSSKGESGKGNQLQQLPKEIGNLTRLIKLGLSDNFITALPPEIGALEKLSQLNLASNPIVTLPSTIGRLTNLTDLNLTNSTIELFPDEISKLVKMKILALGGTRVGQNFLGQIVALHELEELYLWDTQIRDFSEEITRFTKLRCLYLFGDQLTSIPSSLGELKKLQKLHLGGNQLTSIPSFLDELKELQEFNLSNNQLASIPSSLGDLKELREFNLSNNQLASIPSSLGGLKELREFNLSNNQLASIPSSLGDLKELQGLNLSKNQLTALPYTLMGLEKLDTLRLEDNPLDPALLSAYTQGLDALRAFLRSLENSEPLYEAKLILVGEGGVGKTTLLKALTGHEPRNNEPTTHGVSIEIHSMHLPHPTKMGVNIQFNAWDFGGQEVYRVTHQFFLSHRSIYLLVWEPRMGVQLSQVEDWLKLIHLRVGTDAKVIIVSTHARTGQHIARIDKPVFLRDYGSMIVDFIEVDSLVDETISNEKFGMGQLKALIANAAEDLGQMGMPFNVNWRSARDEALELGKAQPRTAYVDFATVCDRHGLDAIDTRTLAGLMHDLGYIVYYGDDDRLKGDVVLQPEWLTKAIGFVLEDHATHAREGILPDAHLSDVWLHHSFSDEPRYEAELYPFFLRLMEKYDVSFRLEDGRTSLVAQHVPQVRPNLPWLPEEEPSSNTRRLAMVCVMDDAPPGLIPWMIVRTHEYGFEQQGHYLHWQKGHVLEKKAARRGFARIEGGANSIFMLKLSGQSIS